LPLLLEVEKTLAYFILKKVYGVFKAERFQQTAGLLYLFFGNFSLLRFLHDYLKILNHLLVNLEMNIQVVKFWLVTILAGFVSSDCFKYICPAEGKEITNTNYCMRKAG